MSRSCLNDSKYIYAGKSGVPGYGQTAVSKLIQLPEELRLIDRVHFDDGWVRRETGDCL